MRPRWGVFSVAAYAVLLLGWAAWDRNACAGAGPDAGTAAAVARTERADASALMNAGTDALVRGDLGRAVLFLKAARRIDPRARDIRVNLAIARARAEEAQGQDVSTGRVRVPSAFALAPAEAWWLAAVLAAAGAAFSGFAVWRRTRRRFVLAGTAAFGLGILLGIALMLAAREERLHPEAVVVAQVVEVGPAPEEYPRPPYLLGAGEEVRLGRAGGERVEVRVSGNPIGWAPRSGLWRVADAPRYTSAQTLR